MVKHRDWNGNFVIDRLFLSGTRLILQLFFDFVNSSKDLFELLVEEVFHVLGMRLDLDDDIAVMLFELRKSEGPICLDQLLFFGLY